MKEGLSLRQESKLSKIDSDTSVTSILKDVRVKDRLEDKAFKALERRLEPQVKMCRACKGDGIKGNGDSCGVCQGEGCVVEDADMRAVELVLAPKFPKTQINVNADLDGMGTDALLKLIEGI